MEKHHSFFATLFLFLLHQFSQTASSYPNHYTLNSNLNNISHRPQQFYELSHPLPSDLQTPVCTVLAIKHSFANTINSPPFTNLYSPPLDCPPPWTTVVLELTATSSGDQYDRIAAVWLSGVELIRTSTAQPNPRGIFWRVHKDVTKYSSVLSEPNQRMTMMLENVINDEFTGVYDINVTLLFYKALEKENVRKQVSVLRNEKLGLFQMRGSLVGDGISGYYESPADMIIPISQDDGDGNRGYWYRIENEFDLHSKGIRIPRNTRRAILELFVSFHGNDEFWYSNPPNSYIRANNLTSGRGNGAYREVFVTIDGRLVGSEVPFPVVFTGGINPLFWEPVVAIGAFDLPSYEMDLTPILEMLLDGKTHEFAIGVESGIPYWLVDANLHLWLDDRSETVEARSVLINTPALQIKRTSKFKQLDGSFKVGARRKLRLVGWLLSSSGNLTTVVSQEYRFSNSIYFNRNGTYKVVKHNIRVRREVKIKDSSDTLVSRVGAMKRHPLQVTTTTLPGSRNDTYMLVTNVTHAMKERYTDGESTGLLENNQDSSGWMEVKDHNVVSGQANTKQTYSYRDGFICYTRTVIASDGMLVADNSTLRCQSSF